MTDGIDVSSYQSLEVVRSFVQSHGMAFGFVKATEGTGYKNPLYDAQTREFHVAGKPVGSYHFLRHDEPATAQALHFMEVIKHHAGSVVLAVDHEADESGQFPSQELCRAFVQHIHDAGYRIGRYASESLFSEQVGADFRWVAKWDPQPPQVKWAIWQTSGTGGIDRDQFNGDRQQMITWWKKMSYRKLV